MSILSNNVMSITSRAIKDVHGQKSKTSRQEISNSQQLVITTIIGHWQQSDYEIGYPIATPLGRHSAEAPFA
jgi:hypothetical protein